MRQYRDMSFLKTVEGKRFSIQKLSYTPEEIESIRLYGIAHPTEHHEEMEANVPYVRLFDKMKKQVVMSDTPMEKHTNQEFLDAAHGDVLIAGLGIGLIVMPLLDDPEITSITVVEKEAKS